MFVQVAMDPNRTLRELAHLGNGEAGQFNLRFIGRDSCEFFCELLKVINNCHLHSLNYKL
jgi:hypothetical protein